MVRKLLGFSRRERLTLQSVKLSGLLSDLSRKFREMFPAAVELEITTEHTPEIRADPRAIEEILVNLLSNARSHTPRGAPVTVRVLAREGEAVVEVADSGPGLASEHAERVFERFFRADPSRARASGGSGLGLSIVAAIIEAHGGRSEVESVPGRGSTFRVVLPLTPDPQADTTLT